MLDNNATTYLQNASIVIFNSLDNKELDEKNTHQLIRILGNILASDNINFVDLLENIFDELDRFISYLPIMREKQIKSWARKKKIDFGVKTDRPEKNNIYFV